jgi:hypothetical protein
MLRSNIGITADVAPPLSRKDDVRGLYQRITFMAGMSVIRP